MDGYAQMSVRLGYEDIKDLEEIGYTVGRMSRFVTDLKLRDLPLGIFIISNEDEIVTAGFPRNVPFEKKQYYKLCLLKETIEKVKEGKEVGGSFLEGLRSLFIAPEGKW